MALLPSWVTPRHIKYGTIAVIGLLHVAALAAPFTFSWTGLILCLILFWVTGGLGITLCYHRLLTHRSYRTPKFVEYILTFFGCLALQGGPITWVATHRVHHKESDEQPDPHTPVVENFLWAHILWNFFDDPKLDSFDKCKRFAKDLARDPVQRFFNKTFFLIYLAGAGVLYTIGHAIGGWELGLSLVVWGVAVRTVLVWHSTWLVNSATHLWGYSNYRTTDNSRNTWWVALITFGEGWHNNHHADQRSAAHGHKWWEFDMTYWTIKIMQWVGLAKDVVKPGRLSTIRAKISIAETLELESEEPETVEV